jgi:hypothetical protein
MYTFLFIFYISLNAALKLRYDRGAEGNYNEMNGAVINNVEITKICLSEFRIVRGSFAVSQRQYVLLSILLTTE